MIGVSKFSEKVCQMSKFSDNLHKERLIEMLYHFNFEMSQITNLSIGAWKSLPHIFMTF